jgi:hypothetical protein
MQYCGKRSALKRINPYVRPPLRAPFCIEREIRFGDVGEETIDLDFLLANLPKGEMVMLQEKVHVGKSYPINQVLQSLNGEWFIRCTNQDSEYWAELEKFKAEQGDNYWDELEKRKMTKRNGITDKRATLD